MAEQEPAKPKRRLRPKSETVREKVQKSASAAASEPKPRRLHKTTRWATAPLRSLGRIFKKVGRFIIPPYFRNSWVELRQVTWPKGKTAWQLTLAVIVFAIVFALLIALADHILDKIFKEVLLK